MSDQPASNEEKQASTEAKLTVGMLANRLNDYQTIFIERMQNFQEYIEQIETRHANEINSLRDRVAQLESRNEAIDNINNRLKGVERAMAPLLALTASKR